MKSSIVEELEQRIWERLEPRIQQEMLARYLSIEECAQYLHVSVSTVRRLVREHTLPSFRVRGQIRIRRMDVDRRIESQVNEGR